MRGFYILVLVFIGVAWLAVLFFGAIFGLQKTFSQEPQVNKLDMWRLEQERKERVGNTREQQQLLMEEYRRKMRDSRRSF